MSQLEQTSTAIQFENQSWLGGNRSLNPQSCTLRLAAFTANTHYPNGYLPSGLEIAQYTSGGNAGLWGPFDKTATDGRQTNPCYLFTSKRVRSTGDIAAAVLEGGQVVIITSKLPIATTLTTTEQANSTRFIYHAN